MYAYFSSKYIVVLAAKVIPNCKVTLGGEKLEPVNAFGATQEIKAVEEISVDAANKVVTTPAYMYGDAPVHQVHFTSEA